MTYVASLSGLGTGGPDDNDGQGGRLVAETLREHPRPGSNTNGQVVAAPLSHGSNPNSNMAGRRREDDFNIVSFDAEFSNQGAPDDMAILTRKLRRAIATDTAVRRLTPTECERLQGLPDGWTNPTGDAPDSRRYAALGDAVTSSVGEWIGHRLMIAHTFGEIAA